MNKTKCVAIVCGIAKSGTTLLSKIINSHSQVFSGWECGALNLDELNFHQKLKLGGYEFGLPDDYLEQTANFIHCQQFYDYIGKNKGSKEGRLQKLIRESEYFVDKTPSYFYQIEAVLAKTSGLNIPVFVIAKNFDNYYKSYVIKRDVGLKKLTDKLTIFMKQMVTDHRDVYFVSYEKLVSQLDEQCNKVAEIVYRYNSNLPEEILSLQKFEEKVKGVDYPYTDYDRHTEAGEEWSLMWRANHPEKGAVSEEDAEIGPVYDSYLKGLKFI